MQGEMDPLHKEKTAFATHNGKWQFVRMRFCLRKAPATFQRVMDNVLEEANWKWVIAYLDIVIFSTTIEEHISHIRDVLQRITQAGLTMHPTKHQICATTFQFLGHIITPGGCHPDPQKAESVKTFPQPQNITDIQRFMGLAGYYRAFIPRFFEVGKPLFALLKKGAPWVWGTSQHAAFEAIKTALIDSTGLGLPDLDLPFLIQTDASRVGIRAVLAQERDSMVTPICFISRGLKPAERNYSTTGLECLAVIWAVRRLAAYIEHTQFTIETDHQPLQWLMGLKEPTGRLARWALRLQVLSFTIWYRKGSQNTVADAL